ncbi:uncharacterized protein ACDL77_022901 [Rhynchocyon petersi]
MSSSNITVFRPLVLTLVGIPGLEPVQCWIGIPFCVMYLIAITGNSLLLTTIKSERSLHEPMYIFLCMLGFTDIVLATSIVPKMLAIFWFHKSEVYFDSCLFQMWLIHTFQGIESGILLAMALDRYTAICYPLRHATIFTHQLVIQIGAVVTCRPAVVVTPCLILIKCRLKFYHATVVSHSYCEHMAVVKLAAEDTRLNKVCGLFAAFTVAGFDLIFITLTYIPILATVFHLPQKKARFKALDTCITHICVFLQFYLLAFFSFFTHRFGSHIPPYIHILLSTIYVLVPPFLNPLVYGLKTKQIRNHAVKMFILVVYIPIIDLTMVYRFWQHLSPIEIQEETATPLFDSTDQITMLTINGSVFLPSILTLVGIPGLEKVQCWIGIPFSVMYLIAVIGNSLILAIIKSENSLHKPMYIFLAMLGATDIALSTCILPKMLGIFWFNLPDIYFEACLLQMWLIHSFQAIESGVLLAMALDRYVAICDPLRHATIFSQQLLTHIGTGVTLRSAVLTTPSILLIKCRLKLYKTTIISHSYCEHMALVKLAVEDIRVNKTYGLFVAFAILGFDIIFITLSYVRIFITVFQLPQKEARFKAFNTCIAHICVFLQFYLLAFFSFFTHRFGSHIPPYVHILLSNLYLLAPPFLNPIVYGIKTKQIRDHAIKMLFSKKAS